jgi:hypothetical protein
VKREPNGEPVKRELDAEPVKREPDAQPVKREPDAESVKREPDAQPAELLPADDLPLIPGELGPAQVLTADTRGQAKMYLRPHGSGCQVAWRQPHYPLPPDAEGYYILTLPSTHTLDSVVRAFQGLFVIPIVWGQDAVTYAAGEAELQGNWDLQKAMEGRLSGGSLGVTVTFRAAQAPWAA